MAVSTTGWWSNSIVLPAGGGDFNIFDKHATPRYAIGTRITRQDGNEYVYSHFGADTNRGVLVATDMSESSDADQDNTMIAPASAVTTTDGTIGSKFIEATYASVTANQFAGGYLLTTDDTGEGYTYRIKGNTATNDPASGNIRIELYDPLQVAIDATTDAIIQGSLYANLEIAVDGTDDVLAGVTVSTMDVSVAAYGWVCVKGVVGILVGTTAPALGDIVALSSEVSGAVMTFGGGASVVGDFVSEEIIGTCIGVGDATGHGLFKVNIS